MAVKKHKLAQNCAKCATLFAVSQICGHQEHMKAKQGVYRPLTMHRVALEYRAPTLNRVHAKGVVLCERTCFCPLSTF